MSAGSSEIWLNKCFRTILSDFQDIYCLTFHEKARDLLTLYLTPWSVLFSRVPAKSFKMTHNVPR